MVDTKAAVDVLQKIGSDLRKVAVDSSSPSVEICEDLISVLEKREGTMTIALLEKSRVGNNLGKALKAFKRHKRTDGPQWSQLIGRSERILSTWKSMVAEEGKKGRSKASADVNAVGLPKTVTEYKNRLVKYNKELYKNPPVLPPSAVTVETINVGLPKRDKKTGALRFPAGRNKAGYSKLPDFRPNRTPEEVLRAGSFGGTYFRAIVSGVTNIHYNPKDVVDDTVDPLWIAGLNTGTMLTSATYRNHINKYGVKCGGSLGMWESSGWITDADPYGWFQWYCRFYRGRRCDDDERQISRWLKSAGPRGRFRSQLCNRILAARSRADDASISPVIRQTLLHWGLEITEDILEKHRKR